MAKYLNVFFLLFLSFQSCLSPRNPELNHVQIRIVKDVEGLNPITHTGLAEAFMMMDLMYQSLLTIDLGSNDVRPVLASSLPEVEVRDSISFFTYTLREEAVWSNGDPITASDVLFTLKAVNAPLINNDKERKEYDFISAFFIDSSSIKKFSFQCVGYVEEMNIMTGGMFILPEHKYDPEQLLRSFSLKTLKTEYTILQDDPKLKKFADHFNQLASSRDPEAFMGSGGYELVSWQTDQSIIFKKKKNWWAEALKISYITANPDQITYQVIPDDATALMALKNGQLDLMRDIPFDQFQVLNRDPGFLNNYNLFTPPTFTVYYVGLNSRLPKFASLKTRQALAHLMDVQSILKVVGQTPESRANSLISPNDERKFNEKISPYDYDLEKVTVLLRDDGWEYETKGWFKVFNGSIERLSFNIQYKAGDFNFENTALIIKQAAEKVGIEVSISPIENSVLGNNLRQHDYEVFLRTLKGNPFAFNFTPILHRQSAELGGMNYTGFGTEESDRLIEEIIKTGDKELQSQKIKTLQEILHEEASLIFLYFDEQKIAVHNRFENLKISGLYPNFEVSAFKLKEKAPHP